MDNQTKFVCNVETTYKETVLVWKLDTKRGIDNQIKFVRNVEPMQIVVICS